MDYHEMLSHLQYEDVIEKAIREKRKKGLSCYQRIAEKAYWGEDFHFPLCNHQPLTRLTVLTIFLVKSIQNINGWEFLMILFLKRFEMFH